MSKAVVVDPAFAGVGKKPGLTLWRVENKLVVKQPAVSDLLACAAEQRGVVPDVSSACAVFRLGVGGCGGRTVPHTSV